ncbi:MAG: hypothetical protein WD530_03435 [Vicingaceae bacterium]
MQKEAKQKAKKQTFWFAILIYLINVFISPILEDLPVSVEKALIGIPITLLSSVFFFFIAYYFERKYPKK